MPNTDHLDFVDKLKLEYNLPGYVGFKRDEFGFPIVTMSHRNGEECIVSLHGGNITSWKGRDGYERIFRHPDYKVDGIKPIKGSGIELVFPQFGPGFLPIDGFANKLNESFDD